LNHSVLGLAAILLFSVSGCQIYLLKKAPSPTEDIPKETRQEKEEISTLLEKAELAIQKDQLFYPNEDNAYAYLSYIIALDSDNIEAKRGFEKIIERYIQLSIKAINRKQFNRAQSMLDRARLVDKEHPSIAPAQKQLDLISSSKIDVLKINKNAIDVELEQRIASFGLAPPKQNCRFLISASNDEQGRSIYQKLKGAQNSVKLNAQINIKLPTQIERQCFNR
jgi:hypothetical protein